MGRTNSSNNHAVNRRQLVMRSQEAARQSEENSKLKISKPDDEHEKEAEKISRSITESPGSASRKPNSGKPTLERAIGVMRAAGESEEQIMRFIEKRKGEEMASEELHEKLQSSKGSGQEMDDEVKEEMESKIGAELSGVKIHTDGNAHEMAEGINAKAFTHGQDIYFKQGNYDTNSIEGKQLLAHELTHTVQQKAQGYPGIQRQIRPKDISDEMLGKQFMIDKDVVVNYKSGSISFSKGQIVTVVEWDNNSKNVKISAVSEKDKKPHDFIIDKSWISTFIDKKSGLAPYYADVSESKQSIKKGEKDIQSENAKIPERKKYGTMNIHEQEITRLEETQTKRYEALNERLIQETMYNTFDTIIKKWVDHYNDTIGTNYNWKKLDPNYVKSLIFQESGMGTSGLSMLKTPRVDYDIVVRFNITQAIKSSGEQQIIMMNENDKTSPSLESKYKYSAVTGDMLKAKEKYEVLEKKRKTGLLNKQEESVLEELKQRSLNGTNWTQYYWTDPRFLNAVTEFFHQTKKQRNLDYDFWIQTGIRWLFEKRKSVSSWEAAIKAYNGEGMKAEGYKQDILTRDKLAKESQNQKKEFVPKGEY